MQIFDAATTGLYISHKPSLAQCNDEHAIDRNLHERSAVSVWESTFGMGERLAKAKDAGVSVAVLHSMFGVRGTVPHEVISESQPQHHVFDERSRAKAAGYPIVDEYPVLIAWLRAAIPGIKVMHYTGPTWSMPGCVGLSPRNASAKMTQEIAPILAHVDGIAIDVSHGVVYSRPDKPEALDQQERFIDDMRDAGVEVWREPGVLDSHAVGHGDPVMLHYDSLRQHADKLLCAGQVHAICGGGKVKEQTAYCREQGIIPLQTFWAF